MQGILEELSPKVSVYINKITLLIQQLIIVKADFYMDEFCPLLFLVYVLLSFFLTPWDITKRLCSLNVFMSFPIYKKYILYIIQSQIFCYSSTNKTNLLDITQREGTQYEICLLEPYDQYLITLVLSVKNNTLSSMSLSFTTSFNNLGSFLHAFNVIFHI